MGSADEGRYTIISNLSTLPISLSLFPFSNIFNGSFYQTITTSSKPIFLNYKDESWSNSETLTCLLYSSNS
jgi:hypothetical protein